MTLTPVVTGMLKQADTGPAGFALQNGTPTILTWSPPNDGALHSYLIISSLVVTTLEVGGQLNMSFFDPSGVSRTRLIYAAGLAAGFQVANTDSLHVVQGGQPVSLVQQSALTGGAAIIWAQIWGI